MAHSWTLDDRTRALELYRTEGLAAAHHATGVPRSTIRGWAAAVDAHPPAHTTTKTEEARAARATQLDEARDRRILLMATAAELALGAIVTRLRTAPEAEATRDLVGVFTRSQHDLALATGEATENSAVAVTFTVPQASPQPPVVIAQDDLPALGG